MRDLLDDLYARHFPSRSSIFNLVDDYTLFSYYLGQEVVINQAILSPLREVKADTLPSFVLYPGRNGELRYFDHGTGEGGSVLDFIQALYKYKTLDEVYARITEDFDLDFVTGSANENRHKYLKPGEYSRVGLLDVINQPFTSRGLQYWADYHITPEILEEYCVGQVKYIMLDDGKMIRIKPEELVFSYRIGDKHKTYQPFNPELKFRNNFPRTYVEGYYQISKRETKSDILFITKSTKDVMCYRRMNLDAIAPKAENQVIPDFIQEQLRMQYKYIIVVFDDDPAGHKGATRYVYPHIWIPKEENVKDTADYMKKYGPEKTKQLLKMLVTAT